MHFRAASAPGLLRCGCGYSARSPVVDESIQAAEARTLTNSARRAAVSAPGTKVCRQLTIGIAEQAWIRGFVVEVQLNSIRIRIDDPGRFPQTLNGVLLAQGTFLWDESRNWIPCR